MRCGITFVFFFATCVHRVLAGFLPDYRHDSDMALNLTESGVISQIRELNEYKPMRCRTDLCLATKEYDKHKGTFYWPEAVAGYRVFVRCPYSVFEPIYAYRDCVVDSYNVTASGYLDVSLYNISWAEAMIQNCPGPPLEQILNKWKKLGQDSRLSQYAVAIDEVNNVTGEYIDQPVTYRDIKNIIKLLHGALTAAMDRERRLSLDTAKSIFNLLGYIVDYNKRHYSVFRTVKSIDFKIRLLKCATLLTEMFYPESSSIYLIGKHLSLASLFIDHEEHQIQFEVGGNITDRLPMSFELNITRGQLPHGGNYAVNLLYFGYRPLLTDLVLTTADSHFPATTVGPRYVTAAGTNQVATSRIVTQPKPETDTTSAGTFNSQKTVILTDRAATHNNLETIRYRGNDEEITGTEIVEQKSTLLRPLGGVAYVTVRHLRPGESGDRFVPAWKADEVNVSVIFASETRENIENHELRCVRSEITRKEAFTLSEWSTAECSEPTLISQTSVQCECRSQGFLAIFSNIPLPEYIPDDKLDDRRTLAGEREGATFFEFLGFPYHVEVYIISHILRALSLICLLTTVISYVVHKNAQRGTPTKILLQLCYSLICLQLMMYVTEAVAGTEWGCRVSNVIRYYLIMVSLMWNAVEALNMYMMLVKVFNSDISGFVRKAAAVAWGIPLIGIIAVLAVNKRGFDGIYDQYCIFRCKLEDRVLYFAYLIPMATILLHNTVIFTLVVKVLLHHGKARSSDKRRTNWVSLLGAMSMMVLLGVPWLFSAFGAIDATDGDTKLAMVEGVFQVVFIVLMDLQGVFIFLFHCARNEQMRKHWRSTFSSRSATKYLISSIRLASESTFKPEKPIITESLALRYHVASKCPDIWSSDGHVDRLDQSA